MTATSRSSGPAAGGDDRPAAVDTAQPSARDVRVVVAVVVTVLAWASAFVGIRFVGTHLSPGGLTLARLAVGSLALTLLGSLPALGGGTRWRAVRRLSRRDVALVVLIGLAWFAVYNIALNAGERSVDAGTASMIIQVAPVLIAVIAGVVLHEGFPRALVVGGLVAFAGTLLIGVATSTGRASSTGVLLVLVSALAYAVAMVAQKVVLRVLSGLQVTWLACTVGLVACLPFAPGMVRDLARAPTSVVLTVLYLGLVPTAIAFTTWAYALSRTSAGRLGVTTYAVPPVAIALGCVLLGEVPPVLAVVGGVLSLVGVGITRRRPRPARQRR